MSKLLDVFGYPWRGCTWIGASRLKRVGLICAGLACAGLLLSGCKSKDKETLWETYQEPVEPIALPKAAGVSEISELWKKNLGSGAELGYAILKPWASSDGVYAVNRSGSVFKLDAETGSTIWRHEIRSDIFSGVGADDSIVVITLDNGKVVALKADSGEAAWESPLNRQISSIPVVGKGRVVVRTVDGLIVGLNASTGETAWSVERSVPGLSIHGDSTPLITGDAVLVGLANGKLIANNVVTGREYWETEVSYAKGQNELERLIDSDTAPLVSATTVYTATYQGNVAALQLQDASVKWKAKISSRLPMTLGEDRLFVTSELGEIVAINTGNGDIEWTQDSFRGRGMSGPLVVNGRVVVGDSNGNIYSLDAADGHLLESRKVAKGAVVALVSGQGKFFVFSSEGSISALSLLKSLNL